MNKVDWIRQYNMIPHEEGGFYAEIWQAEAGFASHCYYLLPGGAMAKWHRLSGEELWLLHRGGPLEITLGGVGEKPEAEESILLDEANLHCLIPAKTWQSAHTKGDDAPVSCIVSPAFSTTGWELYEESPKWTKE
ncbi:hypothetical protein DSECCO2_648220 [anaerobic digester metagenome]